MDDQRPARLDSDPEKCSLKLLYGKELRSLMVFESGVGHFERKFQGEEGSSTNDSCRQKTRVPVLSRGVICVILRQAVLIQYRRVTHRHTHTRTHNTHGRLGWYGNTV